MDLERLCLVWYEADDCSLGCLMCGEADKRLVRAFAPDRVDPRVHELNPRVFRADVGTTITELMTKSSLSAPLLIPVRVAMQILRRPSEEFFAEV
jgi:hypothetical protein